METKRYTTERGVDIGIVPIPLLLDEIRRSHEARVKPVPTYTITTAAGDTETHPHNETTLQTAEERAAWAEYVESRDTAGDKLNDAIWLAVRLKAIKVELPKDNTWIAEQARMGMAVPEDPIDRRLHYIQTEVIGGVRDIVRLTAIANGADLDEEALSAAEDSFRRAMAGEVARAFGPQPEAQGLAAQAGGLEHEPAAGADTGGPGVGHPAE